MLEMHLRRSVAMNVFGIGGLELLVIMLVGFLVLGPGRMVRMSRKVGKTLSDVKKTTSEFTNMVEQSGETEPAGSVVGRQVEPKTEDEGAVVKRDSSQTAEGEGDDPVSFAEGIEEVLGPGSQTPRDNA